MARKKSKYIIKIKPKIPKVRVPHKPEKIHQNKRKKSERFKLTLQDYISEWEEEKLENESQNL